MTIRMIWATGISAVLVLACGNGSRVGPNGKAWNQRPPADTASSCPAGYVNDPDQGCINLQTDPNNCGAVGKVCSAAEDPCYNGKCVAECPNDDQNAKTNIQDCNGACIDTEQDFYNCGACGNSCGDGEVCAGGQCDAQAAANTIEVSPQNMQGWVFFDDVKPLPGTGSMVSGPAQPPAGEGSARLHLADAADRQVLGTGRYAGTRMDGITAFTYWTYRSSADAGDNLAISLQFDIAYDLTAASSPYQGRLVYEPYQNTASRGVPPNQWQFWDAKAGKWWASRAPGNTVCPQSAPCTFAQVLAHFPNAGVKAGNGFLHLKAGGPWPGFDGNVDALTVGMLDGETILWDFEP